MAQSNETDWSLAVFMHCPEMLFVAGLDGALLHQNLALSRFQGEGDVGDVKQGTKLLDRIHPEDQSAFVAAWGRLQGETVEPVRFECRLRDAEGRYRWLSWSVSHAGGRGELYGALREMSAAEERSAQLTEIKGERKLFQLLVDHLPISVWAVDRTGVMRFEMGNAGLGAREKSPSRIGTNLLESLADKPELVNNLHRGLAGETTHVFAEFNGSYWESWHLPVRDDQGEVGSVFGITLNITEARRTELELRAKLGLIERQQEAIRALSTPIIQVWDQVLTLPLVGMVDSQRVAEVMERLLNEVSRTGARFAILDLTGVETVDTATASHLLGLIRAIRLLGAEGVITGIQPVVAQTMISLGLDFGRMVTLAKLRDGLRLCMKRLAQADSLDP